MYLKGSNFALKVTNRLIHFYIFHTCICGSDIPHLLSTGLNIYMKSAFARLIVSKTDGLERKPIEEWVRREHTSNHKKEVSDQCLQHQTKREREAWQHQGCKEKLPSDTQRSISVINQFMLKMRRKEQINMESIIK